MRVGVGEGMGSGRWWGMGVGEGTRQYRYPLLPHPLFALAVGSSAPLDGKGAQSDRMQVQPDLAGHSDRHQ